MAKRDISELIKKYDERLTSGKSVYLDADEFDELAEYYDTNGDIDLARDVVNDGLAIHTESRSLLFKKAKFLVYDGEYGKALRLLNAKFSGYEFDLYLLKIECFLQLGLQAEAYELVREMLEKEEDEALETVLAEIGFLYVEADFFDEAILYLEKSIEYEPAKVEVLADLSYSYEMVGNFNAAITTTNKILDIDPYSYEAWVNLGKLYSILELFDKAVDAFDFALTINDQDSNVTKLRAHCLSLIGRVEEAIDIFKELLILRPEDISVNLLLAECYQSLDKYNEALTYLIKYTQGIDTIEDSGDIYFEEGNLEMALDIVLNALDSDSQSAELNTIAGDIYFRQRQYEDAEKYFLNAYNVNDNKISLLHRLSVVSIKREDYESAVGYTKRILNLDANNLDARMRLALLYFELDDKDGYESLLSSFSDEELQALFDLIYQSDGELKYDRSLMLNWLNEARECRILFKNLKY